jgi:hypothetical protein
MIVKFIGIFILVLAIQRILKKVGFTEDKIESKKNPKKIKEKFINRELKDRGVGTFGSLQFTYDKEKRKEKNLYDISHLKPEKIKELIETNKGERDNIFKEYKGLRDKKNRTDYEENEYTNLGNHLKNLDTYIGKIERIHARVLVEKNSKDYKESKLKYKPINPDEKLTTEQEEKIYKFPSGDLLDISEDRNILETRIQSFNTDIKIVNKKRIIHELDNKVFNDELNNMIKKPEKDYVNRILNYKIIDDEDNDSNIEEQGLFRKINYQNLTKKNINFFTKIEEYITNILNNNEKLKITGGYDVIKTTDFIVVQRKINYILYNKNNSNEYVYDCEIVVFRESKNHGKHIGFKVLVNNDKISLIDSKVLGIISEDKIMLLKASNEYINNLVYYKYKNKYIMTYNPREVEIAEMPDSEKIFIMRDRMNKLRKDRGGEVQNE